MCTAENNQFNTKLSDFTFDLSPHDGQNKVTFDIKFPVFYSSTLRRSVRVARGSLCAWPTDGSCVRRPPVRAFKFGDVFYDYRFFFFFNLGPGLGAGNCRQHVHATL